MPASEREPLPRQQSAQPATLKPSALSMSDLLASCAAASAVSTPPREERLAEERAPHRDAA
ncbi:hypothetical protein AB0D12_08665 [Streptomyces sp. NPDC048479]|uniref:hypothetical protein n=1 Tax=Streptomyces sp. NPDC048479 TaxID=3154725 RepID=UPI00343425B7